MWYWFCGLGIRGAAVAMAGAGCVVSCILLWEARREVRRWKEADSSGSSSASGATNDDETHDDEEEEEEEEQERNKICFLFPILNPFSCCAN